MGASESRIRQVAVPTRNGRRWLVRLDESTAATYAASVAPIVSNVEAGLSVSAVANRVTGVAPDRSAIHLEPWRDARDRFHKLAAALARRSEALVVADVRACYPSIAHSVVLRSLDRLGCTRRDVRAVMDGLRPFRGVGIRGLPVGPAPSAVLANAVLSHLDAAVRAAGHRHVRWVDDVFVFLRHPEEAGSVLELVGETLATVGLELAGEKTRVMFRSGGCGADALAYPPSMADAPGSLGG